MSQRGFFCEMKDLLISMMNDLSLVKSHEFKICGPAHIFLQYSLLLHEPGRRA